MSTQVLKISLNTSVAIISAAFLLFTISPVVSGSTPQVITASVIFWTVLFWLPVFFLINRLDWLGPFSSHFSCKIWCCVCHRITLKTVNFFYPLSQCCFNHYITVKTGGFSLYLFVAFVIVHLIHSIKYIKINHCILA